jgi:hypothetical protein
VRPGLIHEDEPHRVYGGGVLPPLLALLLHVRTLLFGGLRDFFYRQPRQDAVNGAAGDGSVHRLA